MFKDIQLINITLDEIRRSCTSIEEVRTITCLVSGVHGKKASSYKDIEKSVVEQLQTTRRKLKEVLEDISNFRNATDMLDEDELDFTAEAYALINSKE